MRASRLLGKNSAHFDGRFYGYLVMARKRGNPGWSRGHPPKAIPCLPTGFEQEVRRLGLDPQNCAESAKLRQWCQLNKDRRYIPEPLLKRWGITVDLKFS